MQLLSNEYGKSSAKFKSCSGRTRLVGFAELASMSGKKRKEEKIERKQKVCSTFSPFSCTAFWRRKTKTKQKYPHQALKRYYCARLTLKNCTQSFLRMSTNSSIFFFYNFISKNNKITQENKSPEQQREQFILANLLCLNQLVYGTTTEIKLQSGDHIKI